MLLKIISLEIFPRRKVSGRPYGGKLAQTMPFSEKHPMNTAIGNQAGAVAEVRVSDG
jgi:hypothetical protein